MSQSDSDKEQVDVTNITDKLYKLKANSDNFIFMWRFVWKVSETYKFYSKELTVQLELHIN